MSENKEERMLRKELFFAVWTSFSIEDSDDGKNIGKIITDDGSYRKLYFVFEMVYFRLPKKHINYIRLNKK